MNLLLLVVLVSILLLVLGKPSPAPSVKPKVNGYTDPADYYVDRDSIYGAFKK
jgi:hypothetical protein